MRSVHRAVHVPLGFARCRCSWKLPRKDFLGHFSCTSCSKLLHVAALHPFLGHPTAAPLCIHVQKLLPTAASPPPGLQILSGPLTEGSWALQERSCAVSPPAVSPPHRLWLGDPSAQLPQRWLSFTGEALKGWTPLWGDHGGCRFGLAPELSRLSATRENALIKLIDLHICFLQSTSKQQLLTLKKKPKQHTKEFNKSLKCCIHKHSHALPFSCCLFGYMKARGCHGQQAKGCRSWPLIAPVNQHCTPSLPHSHLWKITFAAAPAEVAVLAGAAGTEHCPVPSPDYFRLVFW